MRSAIPSYAQEFQENNQPQDIKTLSTRYFICMACDILLVLFYIVRFSIFGFSLSKYIITEAKLVVK